MSNSVAFEVAEGFTHTKMPIFSKSSTSGSTIGPRNARIQELEQALAKERRVNKILSVKMVSEQFKIQKITDLAEGYKAEMIKAMSESIVLQDELRRLQEQFQVKYCLLLREQGRNCLETIAEENKEE